MLVDKSINAYKLPSILQHRNTIAYLRSMLKSNQTYILNLPLIIDDKKHYVSKERDKLDLQ